MNDESVKSFRNLLMQNNTIRWLKLGSNKLSDLGLVFCCEGLKASKSLQELIIGKFEKVTENGWNFFLRSMNENRIIEKLDIHGLTKCPQESFDFLKNGNISDFSVSSSALDRSSIFALAASLKQASKLTKFFFEAPSEDSSHFVSIVEVLRCCTDLETVLFRSCCISKLGSDLLRKLVIKAKNLKSITLTFCWDADDQHRFVDDLLKGLESNTSITELDLSESDGECDFAEAYAAIQKNTTLQKLDMEYLKVESEAQYISEIAKIIEKNQSLEDLNLGMETSDSRSVDLSELLKNLKFNKSLTKLSLQGWAMKKEAVPFLCDSLKMNNSLKALDLSFNEFGDDVAIQLADILGDNETLTSLDLSFCQLTNVGFKKLADLTKFNTSLTKLTVDDASLDEIINNEMDDCYDILSNLLKRNGAFHETNKKIAKTLMGHKIGKFFDDILVIFQQTPKKKTISK